jgi:hypothetical protein
MTSNAKTAQKIAKSNNTKVFAFNSKEKRFVAFNSQPSSRNMNPQTE